MKLNIFLSFLFQSARRVAQKYLKVVDNDYYEFESE